MVPCPQASSFLRGLHLAMATVPRSLHDLGNQLSEPEVLLWDDIQVEKTQRRRHNNRIKERGMAKYRTASLVRFDLEDNVKTWGVFFADSSRIPNEYHHSTRVVYHNIKNPIKLEEAINHIGSHLKLTLSEIFILDRGYRRLGTVRIKRSGELFNAFSIYRSASTVQARWDAEYQKIQARYDAETKEKSQWPT